jgi:hypothetical protein
MSLLRPTEQAEIEGLKRYGWSDVEIASMTPDQVAPDAPI